MSLRISEKHGVNPCMTRCFYCLKYSGVALLGRLPGDAEAPRAACVDLQPCEACARGMDNYILLIEASDEDQLAEITKKSEEHKQRYGHLPPGQRRSFIPDVSRGRGFWWVSEEQLREIINSESTDLFDQIMKCRWTFLPTAVWDKMELPRPPYGVVIVEGDRSPHPVSHPDWLKKHWSECTGCVVDHVPEEIDAPNGVGEVVCAAHERVTFEMTGNRQYVVRFGNQELLKEFLEWAVFPNADHLKGGET